MVFFFPLLFSFHLQITYRKVRNLQIGVKKLVGKVLINILHHRKSKSALFLFSIIIDDPAVAYIHSQSIKKNKLMLYKPLFTVNRPF